LRELQIINKKNPWPNGWGQKTSIMGVINLTPDSFSDGGELNSSKKVLDHLMKNKVKFCLLGEIENNSKKKSNVVIRKFGEWNIT